MKMQKPLWLFRFLIFLVGGMWAAEARAQVFEYGDPLDVGRDLDYRLVGEYRDTLVLFRRTRTQLLLQFFSPDLKPARRLEILAEAPLITPLLVVSDKSFFSLVYFQYERGQTLVRVLKMNPQGERVADWELARLDDRYNLTARQLLVSENKKTIALVAPTFDGNAEVALGSLENAKARWKRYLQWSEADFVKDLEQSVVSNDGEIFFIFNQFNTRRRRDKHRLLLLRVDTAQQLASRAVPFTQSLLYDGQYTYDERNQRLVLTGLYTEDSNAANGIFFAQTNFSADSIALRFAEFEESFIHSLTGEKRRKQDGAPNYEIRQVILRQDGGALLLAEQIAIHEYQLASNLYYPAVSSGTQADYLYENILVASLHPDGALHWKAVLHKSQDSENDQARHSSYFLLRSPSSLRLLYNNEIRAGTAIYEYIVQGNGETERRLLPTEAERNLLPEFAEGIQTAANQAVVTHERNNRLYLVRITYP